jgi:hypothetical protein
MEISIRARIEGEDTRLKLVGGSRQWELKRSRIRVVEGRSVTEWEAFRYYSHLESALRDLSESEIRQADDITDALNRVDELCELFREAFEAIVSRGTIARS